MQDYLQGRGDARRFFASTPTDLQYFRRKLDEVQRRFGPDERAAAARALRPTSERARERLDRFVREGGAMVTTGQQAGLFSGPLFTIHKALTAVRLAEALEAELGVVVLPVFWNASEDHDWDEVNHAFLLRRDEVVRVDLPAAERRAIPMSERALPHDIDTTLDAAADAVAGQQYADRCLTLLRDAYRPGVSVAAAFEAVLAQLLAPFDVLLTDAADPAVKTASIPVLAEALESAERHAELMTARADSLIDAGYHAQVAIVSGATDVFFHGNGERERLDRVEGALQGHSTGVRLEVTEALARMEAAPGDFSPNVLLRPVVESAVFPTLAYVGGPGELAYFAQVTPLFEEFGIMPPVAYPRASVTLYEAEMAERLESLGLELSELARARHEIVEEMARRAMPEPLREALARLSRDVTDGYREVIDAAVVLDPTLAGALGSVRNESLSHIGRAERKILRRLKVLEQERTRELDRVRAHLAPGGQPQERVLNVMTFLAAAGPELLEKIAAAIPAPWGAPVA